MATVTITHATLTNAAADTTALVDGPKWDASHTVTGLESVDNTSDANKPVSTATQTALDLKANIASPTFTGTPAAPTAAAGDNSTKIATTAFLKANSVIVTSTNSNIVGGSLAGSSLTTSTQNVLIGPNAGKLLAGGTGENIAIGAGAGANFTTATQNTIVGAEAGTAITSDTGHTLVGYQAGLSLNGTAQTWNTFVGHSAGFLATTANANVAMGRAAGRGFLTDSYCVAIGHAAFFYNNGGACAGVIAIGDSAAGAPVDGTGTNFQGSGLTYWGAIADTNVAYLGRYTGKSSAAARTNATAIGTLARLPLKDNVVVLGHGVTAVETAGRVWEGLTSVTVNSNAGVTLTAAQMLTGIINRTGALVGAFSDTTDTAANIVTAGPGQNCEVPCSIDMVYINNGTGFTATMVAGSGVTLAGIGTGITNNLTVPWRIIVTNSTPGTEAVTIYRVG